MMPAIPSTIAAPASFLNLGVLFFLRRLIFYRLIEEEERPNGPEEAFTNKKYELFPPGRH
jgi:hypothetical protein